jgi:hypothetical protein
VFIVTLETAQTVFSLQTAAKPSGLVMLSNRILLIVFSLKGLLKNHAETAHFAQTASTKVIYIAEKICQETHPKK